MDIYDKTPVKNKQFYLENMDGEFLLYIPLQTKTVYLNSSATLIWHLCDGKKTVKEILNLLEESYPDSHQQISGDVVNTLHELISNQAICLE